MKIGFIGCGNMGTAMLAGILQKGLAAKEEIMVSHLTAGGAEKTRREYGVKSVLNNGEVASFGKILFLAVKPQFYEEVLTEIRPFLSGEQILVGIAPGKTLSFLSEKTGGAVKTARMMPNTPAMVGEGMTGLCFGEGLTEEEQKMLLLTAESFGKCRVMPERLMDAVGTVSGCSPAFIFMLIEAMADAAVLQGMSRSDGYLFSAQAVLGSAKLFLESHKHPGELKDMVCSPGGTTIEGVRVLEKAGYKSAMIEALCAAYDKGKRL